MGYERTKYSVMCCKHDYEPKQGIKFRGQKTKFQKGLFYDDE